MWRVATAAALGFYWHVFIDEGARFVRMALGANGIAGRQGPYLPKSRRSMHVMAVTALDEAFFDSMVVWFGKISLRGCVTSVAEFWRGYCQQMLWFLCIVWRVAIKASDIATSVG